jgi:hypothetical protein
MYKMTATAKTPARPIYQIARDIKLNWHKSVSGTDLNYAARPYLEAMYSLDSINDRYGLDSAKSIVAYFLSNASSWRGDVAKRIKKELNAMLIAK